VSETLPIIDSQDDWESAAEELLSIVERRRAISEQWGETIQQTRAKYREATTAKDAIDRELKERESALRGAMSLYESSGNDSLGVRRKIEFFVENESLIPRKFMQPNEKLIKEVVESMGEMTHIPGIGIAYRYPVYLKTKKESN